MRTIDTNSRLQLYYQLYDILLEKISNGDYKEGDMLPTENELIKEYNISRITVRKAMDMLLGDGLISKKRGIGTFVNSKKIKQELSSIVHFNENMKEYGYKTKTEMILNKIEYATKTIADKLSVNEGEKLVRIDRLRFAHGSPMCIESASLIYNKCPGLLGKDFSEISLRKFLQTEYSIVWKYAKENITAINANKEMSSLLKIDKGQAILCIERISFTEKDEPLEYLKAYYRSDIYYLTATLDVYPR